jgi:hypothetical protein
VVSFFMVLMIYKNHARTTSDFLRIATKVAAQKGETGVVLKSDGRCRPKPCLAQGLRPALQKAKGLNYGIPGQRLGNQRTKDIKPCRGEPIEQRAQGSLGV